MKGTRHSEEQIIAILKQGEAGLTTAELGIQSCKKGLNHGRPIKPQHDVRIFVLERRLEMRYRN